MRKQNRFFLFIFCFLLLATSVATADDTVDTPAAPKVAVILGMYPAGADVPDPQQTARIYTAWKLYKEGHADTFVITGGFTREHISEARMGAIALITLGVPEEAIIEETRASTTVENAYYSRILFEEKGWPMRTLLVSQKMHLMRGKLNYQDEGFKVKNVSAPNYQPTILPYPPAPEEMPELPAPVEAIVVYQPYPYTQKAPMDVPTPGMARRLRAAAAAYRDGVAKQVIVYGDWYTRGPAALAETMKIGLVSLGVNPSDITTVKRVHYGRLEHILKKYGGTPALFIAPPSDTVMPQIEEVNKAGWTPWLID